MLQSGVIMLFDKIEGKIKTYEKGDLIFNEGDKCNYVCIVINGSVKISTTSTLYNEFIISTIKTGESFGENLIFSEKPYYLGDIVATKKTSILFLSKNDYLKYVNENLEEFLQENSKRYLLLQQRTKILLQKSIREKILFYLISKYNSTGSLDIKISSKEELAKYLNIERPSLSRELIKLKEEGLIDYDRHYIYIKKNKKD